MHATIHRFRPGVLVLEPLDGEDGFVILLGDEDRGTRDTYRIVAGTDYGAAGRRPLFAQLTWLNGAGDPAVAAAAARGGRDRIGPAVRDVEGLVSSLVLESDDHRIVVVSLTTALETFDLVREVILSTELLPGEDPALLPGPDRVEQARVLLAALPAGARS